MRLCLRLTAILRGVALTLKPVNIAFPPIFCAYFSVLIPHPSSLILQKISDPLEVLLCFSTFIGYSLSEISLFN